MHRDHRRQQFTARSGVVAIPQVFAGGTLIGGATDVIEALRGGKLQP
jgi:glutaredoxin